MTTATQGNAGGLEEYNPFDGQRAPAAGAAATTQPAAPAVMSPTQDSKAPPQYTASPQQQVNTEQLQRQQEELERKDEELRRREEALRTGQLSARQNNWPPLPSFVPIGPCFYQDINVDIPLEFQRITRHLYYLWGLHSLVLLVNIVGGLAMWIQFGEFAMFGLALLYFALFTPASYVCWFRPVYKAFRSDSSFNFMVFFFTFFFQMMVSGVHAIGFANLGACGIYTGLWAIGKGQTAGNYVVGILALLIGIGFALVALCDFVLIVKVHKIYRTSGASMVKAQAEFTSGVMRNENVQAATADFAANAVRSQMSSSQSGGGGGGRF